MNEPSDSQRLPRGQKQPVLRRFATKLCVSITLAVGLLAAVECAFYLISPAPLAPPSDYKAYVVWQVVRPTLKTVTVDAEGLRRTYYSHCDAGEYTIWMFGGSGMWGEGIHDWETIPSQLARHYEESGRRICIRNYGQEGWVSTQELIKLILELKRTKRKPDAVVFYDGTLDSHLPYESDEVDVHWAFPVVKKGFESWKNQDQAGFKYLQNTNTYHGLQSLAGKFISNPAPSRAISTEQASAMADRTVDNYSKNIEILGALAAHYAFRYIFLWEPYLMFSQKPLTATEELLKAKEAKSNPDLVKVMRATYERCSALKSPHFIFLGSLFNDHRETLFRDRSHLNPEGYRFVAERIAQTLQQPGS